MCGKRSIRLQCRGNAAPYSMEKVRYSSGISGKYLHVKRSQATVHPQSELTPARIGIQLDSPVCESDIEVKEGSLVL